MNLLDLEMLELVKKRYEAEKKAFGLLNKKALSDWEKKKSLRQDLNKKNAQK